MLDLADIKCMADGCSKCHAARFAKSRIMGQGPIDANVLVVTDVPTKEDEKEGHALSGASGELFDKALAHIGVNRSQLFITSMCKCPLMKGERDTITQEANACLPILYKEIELVQPRGILALGTNVLKHMIKVNMSMVKTRGTMMCGPHTTVTMPTYHPMYLLQNYKGSTGKELRQNFIEDLMTLFIYAQVIKDPKEVERERKKAIKDAEKKRKAAIRKAEREAKAAEKRAAKEAKAAEKKKAKKKAKNKETTPDA